MDLMHIYIYFQKLTSVQLLRGHGSSSTRLSDLGQQIRFYLLTILHIRPTYNFPLVHYCFCVFKSSYLGLIYSKGSITLRRAFNFRPQLQLILFVTIPLIVPIFLFSIFQTFPLLLLQYLILPSFALAVPCTRYPVWVQTSCMGFQFPTPYQTVPCILVFLIDYFNRFWNALKDVPLTPGSECSCGP